VRQKETATRRYSFPLKTIMIIFFEVVWNFTRKEKRKKKKKEGNSKVN
jgi:hypothetical protein